MPEPASTLSTPERALVDEEEALLARVQRTLAALAAAQEDEGRRSGRGDLRSIEALRELREEARTASEDDLPALLHEMAVRGRLLEKDGAKALPDASTPYLAHLRVREGGVEKDYLLGHVSLVDSRAGVRVVDWRMAPVARLFYRCREGDDYEEEFPGRIAEGTVVARRIVVIERGTLTRIVGDGLAVNRGADGAWESASRAALAFTPGGGGARDVTALLDSTQYDAITAPPEHPLLVLGSAGSGKTTVALHRLARIAAQDRSRYPLARTRVVVPEVGLCRLSRRLLAPLGVGAEATMTLDAWALELCQRAFAVPLPRLSEGAPGVVTHLKRDPSLYRALRAKLGALKPAGTTWRKLRARLAELFTDRVFLAEVVNGSGGTLPRSAIEETVRHTLLQIAAPLDLTAITDRSRRRALDGRGITEGTPEALAGTLDVEDVPILLFLKAFRGALPRDDIAQLVVDEAEDFSLFDLFVLGRLLGSPRSVTLAGDEQQQTSTCFAGWPSALEALGLGPPGATTVRLAVSYRCPRSVVDLAQTVLAPLLAPADGPSLGTPPPAAREGAPVGKFRFTGAHHAHLFVAGAISDLADREPGALIAVVHADADLATEAFELVRHRGDARLVLHGEFSFEPGIDVTHVDAVKGLEFDYVVIPDATAAAYPDTDVARRRLHVAITRTAHQLWLVAGGPPTPLVSFESLGASAPRDGTAARPGASDGGAVT